MAEPDNLVLEILRGSRSDVREARAEIKALDERVNARIDHLSEQVEGLDTRLSGLTHAVVAGFGVFVHRLDEAESRVARLERDRA